MIILSSHSKSFKQRSSTRKQQQQQRSSTRKQCQPQQETQQEATTQQEIIMVVTFITLVGTSTIILGGCLTMMSDCVRRWWETVKNLTIYISNFLPRIILYNCATVMSYSTYVPYVYFVKMLETFRFLNDCQKLLLFIWFHVI